MTLAYSGSILFRTNRTLQTLPSSTFFTLHLFTLKSIFHLFTQATNLPKVLCINLISLRVFTRLAIFMSSANLEISQSTSSSISSIKIVKRSGPKTAHCGTPLLAYVQRDMCLFNCTRCFLSSNLSAIHLRTFS